MEPFRSRNARRITELSYRASLLLLLTALSSACTGVERDSTGPLSSENGIRQGKNAKQDTSQANLVWAESVNIAAPGTTPNFVAAGIRGDGRDKHGQPASFSEYQGKFCGVSAYLGVNGGSSLNSDSDFGYKTSMGAACGGSSRLQRFYYNGASTPTYSFGPHFVVLNLAALSVGQTVTQAIFYGVQQSGCQRLYFSSVYSPSNDALITRLPDVAGAAGVARQWRVESQGTHRAMCINVGNGGKLISSGVSHFLPFSYTLTEVPPPAPVYP